MRYPPGHKEQTRQRILMSAAKVFRNQGFGGGGVDCVMGEAGLTAGGFYSHFKNKEDLLMRMLECSPETMTEEIAPNLGEVEGTDWVEAFIDFYLSPEHIAAPEQCCPLPSIISEIERQSQSCRDAFAELFLSWRELIAEKLTHLPEEIRESRAEALNAFVIGTATMARAMMGTPQFETVLENGRQAAKTLLR